MFQNGCYHVDQRTLKYLLAMFEPNSWYNFLAPLTVWVPAFWQREKIGTYLLYVKPYCTLMMTSSSENDDVLKV